jgi:hypothetical protein
MCVETLRNAKKIWRTTELLTLLFGSPMLVYRCRKE